MFHHQENTGYLFSVKYSTVGDTVSIYMHVCANMITVDDKIKNASYKHGNLRTHTAFELNQW